MMGRVLLVVTFNGIHLFPLHVGTLDKGKKSLCLSFQGISMGAGGVWSECLPLLPSD